MPDPATDPLLAQYDGHIRLAERLPSPFYASLLRRMRADAEEGGPMRTALAGHERDAVEQWDIYRLLSGVHRVVLSGDAPSSRRTTRRPAATGTPRPPGPPCATSWPRGGPRSSRR